MSFIKTLSSYYIKSFDFNGRAGRKEYWYPILLFTSIFLVLKIFIYPENEEIISNFFLVLTFFPTIAVTIRRLHDTNHSGWFILIPVYNIVLYLRKGVNEGNKYTG